MTTQDNLIDAFSAANILLTPFRTQNVPPPMSSSVLTLLPPSSLANVPLHAAFSPTHDHLGVLWRSGLVEIFDLRTRIGPGSGKVLDPVLLCSGLAFGSNDLRLIPRQIALSTSRRERVANVAVLAWGPDGDVITIAHVHDGFSIKTQVRAPGRDGRLVQTEGAVEWQSSEGYVDIREFSLANGLLVLFMICS